MAEFGHLVGNNLRGVEDDFNAIRRVPQKRVGAVTDDEYQEGGDDGMGAGNTVIFSKTEYTGEAPPTKTETITGSVIVIVLIIAIVMWLLLRKPKNGSQAGAGAVTVGACCETPPSYSPDPYGYSY